MIRLTAALLFVAAAVTALEVGTGSASLPHPPTVVAPTQTHATPPGAVHHVLVISIDGMLPDVYMNPDAHGLKVPTLRRFKEQGAYSEGVRTVFPSTTYPSHTSIATGVWPRRHGIQSNHFMDPLADDMDGWRWYEEDIKADPIWRVAERAGYHVGMVHWPVGVGAEVTFNAPEYWRAYNANDKKLIRSLATPGLLDRVAREHKDFWLRYDPSGHCDDAVTDIAVHLILAEQPELLFVHLLEVDGAQHPTGLYSTTTKFAIEKDDAQVARMLAALADVGIAKDTNVVVLSDHGFMPAATTVRPGVLLKDAGLVTLGTDGKISDWKATILTNGGSAYFYLKDKTDTATRAAIEKIYAAKGRDVASGVGRLYSEADIAELGGDPDAFMAIEAATGFQFAPGVVGTYAVKSTSPASHGYDPRRPEMRASLLIVGPQIPHGVIEHARVIDIAPTIAAWLGLAMPGVDGTELDIRRE